MPDLRLLSLARECRERTKKTLTQAETWRDGYAKQQLREIAEKLEKLAERLEQAAADEP
jgi:uncharacterized protein Yka (UPF0111/DUF47 family)